MRFQKYPDTCGRGLSEPTVQKHQSITTHKHGRGGGGSSIVKVPGDVPPARVYFFKLSNLAKGTPFANFSHSVCARVCLLAISVEFSLGKGMLFGNFGQRNVKLR